MPERLIEFQDRLPGESLRIGRGFVGHEPEPLGRWYRSAPAHWTRLAVIIQCDYPDIAGSYFLNRRLIHLVQESLALEGVWAVLADIYRPDDGILPCEVFGGIETDEKYVLVDRMATLRGGLWLWALRGSAPPVYAEGESVLDILLVEELADRVVSSLTAICGKRGVPIEDCGQFVPQRSDRQSTLARWWRSRGWKHG